ncbi:MAG: hypothetical protein ACLFRK_03220 [Candidatus Nanohaloarchaea archaeon]
MASLEDRVVEVEERVENVIPENQRARLKVLMDQLMPVALMLLGSLITFHYFVSVSQQLSQAITVLNYVLIGFFTLRLGLGFSLADSHRTFLRQHWFDALLVIPTVSLLNEARFLTLLEAETEEQAVIGFLFTRSTVLAGQITRIFKIIWRTVKF